MPRKTYESTVQNRNNQRLSRARRRGLIEDLQRRLQEYERRGVEASLEMQRAARSVVLENQRLRALLAARGVSQDEIAAHLFAPDAVLDESARRRYNTPPAWDSPRLNPRQMGASVKTAPQPAAVSSAFRTVDLDHLPSPPTTSAPSPFSALPGRASPDPAESVSAMANFATVDAWQEPRQEEPCQTPRRIRDQYCTPPIFDNVPDQDASSILPSVSDCYCPPMSPKSVTDTTSTSEISCEAAARILAEIRGHADLARDLSALGCTGLRDCMVSNTSLFQLMDEMG
ncbi:hypothetical protein RB595_007652 [Gaeumannomyces hyphopodioides]